jgi:hypothetical protein
VGKGGAGKTRPLVGQVKDPQILEQARHGRQPRAPPIFQFSQMWNESLDRGCGGNDA